VWCCVASNQVFLSIKGVYFQADVNGHTVTWLQPWQFTPNLPRIVDFKVMATFLQFYEVLLKFVLHKLYHQMGLSYPPVLLEDVEAHGGNLAALQLKAVTGDGGAASSKDAPKLSTAAAKAQLASVQKAVAAAVAHAGNVDETLVSESEQSDSENDVGDGYDETSAEAIAAQKAKRALQRLFKGKTFFLSREVPRDLFEFIIQSFGGKVGWDGVGSTLRSDSPTITHHVIDRPTVVDAVKGREYVQPQWVVDSINTCMLLPIAKYAPGVDLPVSPFACWFVLVGLLPRTEECVVAVCSAALVSVCRRCCQGLHPSVPGAVG
jgi:pescadillo